MTHEAATGAPLADRPFAFALLPSSASPAAAGAVAAFHGLFGLDSRGALPANFQCVSEQATTKENLNEAIHSFCKSDNTAQLVREGRPKKAEGGERVRDGEALRAVAEQVLGLHRPREAQHDALRQRGRLQLR